MMTDLREMKPHDLSIRMRSWILGLTMLKPEETALFQSEISWVEEIDRRLRREAAMTKEAQQILDAYSPDNIEGWAVKEVLQAAQESEDA